MASSPEEHLATARYRLEQRVRAAAPLILGDGPGAVLADVPLAKLIGMLGAACRTSDDASLSWLLLTAVTASFPSRDQLLEFTGQLRQSPDGLDLVGVLEGSVEPASLSNFLHRELDIVVGGVVVDVDFCARRGHNTGIQRVVRETMRRWHPWHSPLFVAWTEDGRLMRTLTSSELARVVDWSGRRSGESSSDSEPAGTRMVVPWRSSVMLPEVAQERISLPLASFAEFSGNRTIAVGYDAIPVVSAQYVTPHETNKFVRYLSAVKHMDAVLGISASASDEFRGFRSALVSQGLPGPEVATVSLPVDAVPTKLAAEAKSQPSVPRRVPLLLAVGSFEPRKNQTTILAAAERLWASGLEFELLFIGGGSPPLSSSFDAAARLLQRKGRSVVVNRNADDGALAEAYRTAICTIFVSLHEGYGLPVAESLAVGTPVIATDFGSVAEITDGGGCIAVDPRDVGSVSSAMRSVIEDPAVLARLAEEIEQRPKRSWDDYASELWDAAGLNPTGATR